MTSPGVTDAGAEVLKQRGVLSQEEIHKLAHKGKKAACHSRQREGRERGEARADQHAQGARRGGE